MKINKILLSICLALALVAGSFYFFSKPVASGEAHNIRGWMWGEGFIDSNNNGVEDPEETAYGLSNGGIGWISLNSLDCDPDGDGKYQTNAPGGEYELCPTSGTSYNYGVNAAGAPGDRYRTLSGYAWSDNYGWISFGSDAGTPPSPTSGANGTVQVSARINNNGSVKNLDDDYIEGWARVVSAGTRTNTPNSKITGGWTGWISLRNISNPKYSISPISGEGYGWGDTLIGWIQSKITLNPDLCLNISGTQSTAPVGTQPDSSGNCVCINGGNNPPICTPPPVPGQCSSPLVPYTCQPGGGGSVNTSTNGASSITWSCLGTNGGSSESCSSPCSVGQVVIGGVCMVPPPDPLTAGTYEVVPRLVNSVGTTCTLRNWTLQKGGRSLLPSEMALVSCKLDGTEVVAPGSYTGSNSTQINVGTHTLTCTDGLSPEVEFNTPSKPRCLLNPNVGEF